MNRTVKFIAVILFTLCFFKSRAQVGTSVITTTYVSWVQLPEGYDSTKKYPVLMMCHGIGEGASGLDSSTYMAGGYLDKIYNNSNYPAYFRERGWSGKGYDIVTGDSIGFIIVSPQMRTGAGSNWFYSGVIGTILNNINTLYSVDTNRVYITGLSGGGKPSIDYAAGVESDGGTVYNKKYVPAAIVPMSSAGGVSSRLQAGLLASKNIPIWQFTGTTDDNYTNINNFHGYVLDSGGVSRITNYSGGHCCWGTYYNPNYKEKIGSDSMNIYTWLLQYKRGSTAFKSIYVSSSDGSDSRTFEQAQSPSTPWKTIAKVNGQWGALSKGDTVKFKSGDTFYGQLIINKNGGVDSPMVITSYGSGELPKISGFTTLTSWTNYSGNIYKTSCVGCDSLLNLVVINDIPRQKGRTPNSGYNIYESNTLSSITDNELSGTPNWTGAQVVVRKSIWTINVHRILSHVGSTLYIDSVSQYSPQNNFGYFIQDDVRTLDTMGEWYFNPVDTNLYVYFPTDPSNYTVKVPTIDTLVKSFINVHDFKFSKLRFEGANQTLMQWRANKNVTIEDCEFEYSGLSAIFNTSWAIGDMDNFKLRRSTIKNMMSKGVDLGISSSNAFIDNNRFDSIGYYAGMAPSKIAIGQWDGMTGVLVGGASNVRISNNELSNIGFIPILFRGDTNIVEKNIIHDYAFVKSDAGGIYTSMYSNPYKKTGIIIRKNRIYNGLTNFEGTTGSRAYPQTFGVYLDDSTSNVLVEDNVMYNIQGTGFYAHNNRSTTFRNNITYGCDWGWADQYEASSLSNNMNVVIKDNQFVSTKDIEKWGFTVALGADEDKFGVIDSNYYVKNTGLTNVFTVRHGSWSEQSKTFSQWQSYGQDAHSTTLQKTTTLIIGDSTGHKTLFGTYQDVKGNVYSGTVSLQPYQALMLYPFEGVLPVTIKQFFIYRKKIKFQ